MVEVEEVYLVDVLTDVCAAMKVAIPDSDPVAYFDINFEPGKHSQIMQALISRNGTSLDALKYPLIAVVMPIPERSGSGFLEVIFPRIVIAYLTKTSEMSEYVKDKYSSDGVIKNILRPCMREFIRQFAFSRYTSMGDPDAYEYVFRENPSMQKLGDGLPDFVDIVEILNLKATIFSQIKSC